METLWSRFYTVISGTSSDINMGSSRELTIHFFALNELFQAFTFELEERYQLSDFMGVAE